MILIPKHVSDYINKFENELNSLDTPATRFYKQELANVKKLMDQMSSKSCGEEQFRIVLFYFQRIIKLEQEAHIHTGIPRLGKFSKDITIDPRLINLLNYLTIEPSDLSGPVHDLGRFIKENPSGLEPPEAYCDFKEFKLITSKEKWEKIKSLPGKDVKFSANNGKPTRLKLYFVRKDGYHSMYPRESYDELKKLYVEKGQLFTPDGFESIKIAFDIWFHVGSKGTYYVYIEE